MSTDGPQRVILAQVGWCYLGQAEAPVSVQCGSLEFVRVGREAPTNSCGVDFWAAFSADRLSNVDCLIKVSGTENDFGAVITSIENASQDLEFKVLGGTDLEPAILEIPWSRDSSYILGFGLGFPPGSLTPSEGNTLLRNFELEGGDQFWGVGMPGSAEAGSFLGVYSDETWTANHVLMIEVTAR